MSKQDLLWLKLLGYEIKDLEEKDIDLFQKEADNWTPKVISKIQGSQLILGGPDNLAYIPPESLQYQKEFRFERVYTDLPPHKYVTVLAKVWYFGDFSQAPEVIMMISSLKEPNPKRQSERFQFKKKEFPVDQVSFNLVKRGMEHEGSTLILEIEIFSIDIREVSFGFREISIHLSNYSVNLASYMCSVALQGGNIPKKMSKCSCPENQGLNKNSVCQDCPANCDSCFDHNYSLCLSCSAGYHWRGNECNNCHLSCQTCSGPTEHECLNCNFGFFKYGNGSCLETCEQPFRKEGSQCIKPCKQGELFWMHNKSCTNQCLAPFVRSVDENGVLLCESPCSRRYFIYSDGSCHQFCPVPLAAYFDGRFKICKNPCHVVSQYLYWNRSCLENCPAPLKIESKLGTNYCVNPCEAPSNYLYHDGSCSSSCHWPMKIKAEFRLTYCLPPCDLVREYILSDGSCATECPAPLISKIESGVGTYCLSPCESQDDFILNNGSCSVSCPAPLKVSLNFGIKHCGNPCLLDEYYYSQNKSCLDKCSPPLKIRSESEIRFCINPCPELANPFYYLEDGGCYDSCNPPLLDMRSGGQQYCWSNCKSEHLLYEDGTCQMSCQSPFHIIQKGPYQICLKSVNITQEISIVKILALISEIGGILECFLNGGGDSTSILMMPLLNLFEPMERRNLEKKFDKSVGKVIIIYITILLFEGLSRIVRHHQTILKRFSLTLKWNILASVFISILGDVMFYFFVSIQEMQSWTDIFKSQRVLISGIMIIPLMIFILLKIINISSERDRGDYPRWRFIFEAYKSDSIYQQLFLLIYIFRVILVSMVLACLENSPGIQAALMIFISFGILYYLIQVSPIQNRGSFIQHIVNETVLLLYNILLSSLMFEFLRNILHGIALVLTGLIIIIKLLCNLGSDSRSEEVQTEQIQLSNLNHNESSLQQDFNEIEPSRDSDDENLIEADVLIS